MPVKKKKPTVRKSKGKILYSSNRQTGSSSKAMDKKIKAKPPGKRQVKGSKPYYEYRKNRTDKKGSLTGITKHDAELKEISSRINFVENDIKYTQSKIKESKSLASKSAYRLIIAVRKKEFSFLKNKIKSLSKKM